MPVGLVTLKKDLSVSRNFRFNFAENCRQHKPIMGLCCLQFSAKMIMIFGSDEIFSICILADQGQCQSTAIQLK